MDIISSAQQGDFQQLRKIIESNSGKPFMSINHADQDRGRTALHYAVVSGNQKCIDLLVSHPLVNIDAIDLEGNSALHLAAQAKNMDAVRALTDCCPDYFIKNNMGQGPSDKVSDPAIESFLNVKITKAARLEQYKKNQLVLLENELPNEVSKLKAICIDLLLDQNIFEDRCKDALRQLIEEKRLVSYKMRLLEQAAGIPDSETGERYMEQLQFWADENTRLTSTISYLKGRIQILESSITQQDDYYKQNMAEMSRIHKEQLQTFIKRMEDTEKTFLASQKSRVDDSALINRLKSEIDVLNSSNASIGGIVDYSSQKKLQEQLYEIRKQLGEVQAERVTLTERLKLAESLRELAEKEVQTTRDQLENTRKGINNNIISQIEQRHEQARSDESEEQHDIIFVKNEGGQKVVKAGKIDKLIQRLVDPNIYDNHYMQTFLLTHTEFISSKTFLTTIVKLCFETVNSTKSASDSNPPSTSLTSPILLKAVNIMKYWVEQYWVDFQSDPELLKTLTLFSDSLADELKQSKLSQMLKNCIAKKTTVTEAPKIERQMAFPKPVLPKALAKRYSNDPWNDKNLKLADGSRPSSSTWNTIDRKSSELTLDDLKLKIMDIDSLELARQITLIEFELFSAIKVREFVDLAWMKEDKDVRAPNIMGMVRWSNHIIKWFITEIVSIKDNVKQRAAMMEKIIAIAQNLEKLNNFNGVKEVLAALQSSSVYRLKKTKELIGGKSMKVFDELTKLTANELNYKHLRAKVHAVDPPLIPFPGVYQGDLVFLETGGRDNIENGMINFQKFQKIASYVLELQTYQQVPYQLGPIHEIQDPIRNATVLDEDQAYNLSLMCEPRC